MECSIYIVWVLHLYDSNILSGLLIIHIKYCIYHLAFAFVSSLNIYAHVFRHCCFVPLVVKRLLDYPLCSIVFCLSSNSKQPCKIVATCWYGVIASQLEQGNMAWLIKTPTPGCICDTIKILSLVMLQHSLVWKGMKSWETQLLRSVLHISQLDSLSSKGAFGNVSESFHFKVNCEMDKYGLVWLAGSD